MLVRKAQLLRCFGRSGIHRNKHTPHTFSSSRLVFEAFGSSIVLEE